MGGRGPERFRAEDRASRRRPDRARPPVRGHLPCREARPHAPPPALHRAGARYDPLDATPLDAPPFDAPPLDATPLDGRATRLIRYLPGRLLSDTATSTAQWAAVGRMLARVALALAEFDHPAASRWLAWDLAHLDQLAELVPMLPHDDQRSAVGRLLADLAANTLPTLRLTPRQAVHNDFHGGNLIVDPGAGGFVTGILDFGDVVRTHRSADLAIAMSYAIPPSARDGDPWTAAIALAAGYRDLIALPAHEVALLPQLVRGRLAQRLLLGSWMSATRSENAAYTARNLDATWRQFLRLSDSPPPHGALGH
ncbi:phosphotransferase [Glaciihabitans sp. INWT7]|uniref:phosphotransferase n=1 Tax=Glaciihabitans sp. INWT7 TaxID=2596912 RepID=UPI001626F62C|nr:phosphotransferase [Glaciihabitans sp. INWT7]QNE46501.1 phosphotransferase [Glaciihabitans sp. INWT7]